MIVYPLYLDYKGACSGMLKMHIFKTKEDRDMFMKHIQNAHGAVCPGNHASLIGKFKHDVTNAMKDELFPDGRYDKDIVVEEDVWMGINVTLLNGAHIGRGAIIGAGCVVTGEIPPYAIAVGNPCQVKRFLFTPEEIIKHENELYPKDERYPLEELIAIQQKYSK